MSNQDTKTGFVFKDQDNTVYLGLFENGSVSEFTKISDWDGIYDDLTTAKVMVVEVKFRNDDSFSINDLCRFEMGAPDDGSGEFVPADVVDVLHDLQFPSEAVDNLFGSFLSQVNKSN